MQYMMYFLCTFAVSVLFFVSNSLTTVTKKSLSGTISNPIPKTPCPASNKPSIFVAEAYPQPESFVQKDDLNLAPMPAEFTHKEYFDSSAGPAEILGTIRNDIEAEFVQRSGEEADNKRAFTEKNTMLKVPIWYENSKDLAKMYLLLLTMLVRFNM